MSTPYGNLTEKTSEALQQAQSEAMQRRNPSLEPSHILHGLLAQEGGVALGKGSQELVGELLALARQRVRDRFDVGEGLGLLADLDRKSVV